MILGFLIPPLSTFIEARCVVLLIFLDSLIDLSE